MNTGPTLESKRIVSLDMMRGLAILGIFLVNMLSFHSPILHINPIKWWDGGIDRVIYQFIDIFAQASFYPLFSLLFGYGLVVLRENVIKKELIFLPIALRRLSLLLVIGLIHAFFIWHGDILFTYALLGFIFLLFIRLNGKSMLIIGSLLYILPNLLFVLLFIVAVMLSPETASMTEDPAMVAKSLEIYGQGSFIEITKQRMSDWYSVNNVWGVMTMIVTLLPLFLIGGAAAKYKWLERVTEVRKGLKITLFVTLTIGLVLKFLPYLLSDNILTQYLQDIFGGALLAISYGLMIALMAEKKPHNPILVSLSYVGRLSLSNYLLQSVISTFIFYHYGLGFYGDTSVLTGTILVLVIYTAQIFISRIWVKSFYFGPMEWLWRNFSYFKVQKFKKREANHSE
jgi:uncharacterized protein